MKMGKHEELKDKQISSQSISFTAIYTRLWIWKLAPSEQLSAWTIGTDLVIIAEHMFSRWVTSPLGSQVDFSQYMSEKALPVRPALCEQNRMLSLSQRYYKRALCSVNSGHWPAETS